MKTSKQRLQDLAGIKKPLNEGYAWERDENGALPTLASSTARHAANENVVKEAVMSTEEAEDMAVEILNQLMDNDIIERGFDEELATELIVLTLTGDLDEI